MKKTQSQASSGFQIPKEVLVNAIKPFILGNKKVLTGILIVLYLLLSGVIQNAKWLFQLVNLLIK